MKDCNSNEAKVTIGMDLSDRHAQVCVLDAGGSLVEEGRIVLTQGHLRERWGSCEPARIVIEAGTHSPWVSRVLANCGHEVIVANPRKVRMIYESDNKTDRTDARKLARLGRVDPELLGPIRHRGEEAQADLAVLRAREALVRARTALVNHVRGAVKAVGQRLKKYSTTSFHKKVIEEIPPQLKVALSPLVETIQKLSEQIRALDKRVEEMGQTKYPETARLRQVPGVGALTSLAYVLTIEDPGRFSKSRDVGGYLGMVPRRAQSGRSDPEMRITKAGDECLRRLLVGSAQYILGPFGPPTDLRQWGLALAKRGGKSAKKRAVVAVARKLSVLLHRLWVNEQEYEPNRKADRTAKKTKEPLPA